LSRTYSNNLLCMSNQRDLCLLRRSQQKIFPNLHRLHRKNISGERRSFQQVQKQKVERHKKPRTTLQSRRGDGNNVFLHGNKPIQIDRLERETTSRKRRHLANPVLRLMVGGHLSKKGSCIVTTNPKKLKKLKGKHDTIMRLDETNDGGRLKSQQTPWNSKVRIGPPRPRPFGRQGAKIT